MHREGNIQTDICDSWFCMNNEPQFFTGAIDSTWNGKILFHSSWKSQRCCFWENRLQSVQQTSKIVENYYEEATLASSHYFCVAAQQSISDAWNGTHFNQHKHTHRHTHSHFLYWHGFYMDFHSFSLISKFCGRKLEYQVYTVYIWGRTCTSFYRTKA